MDLASNPKGRSYPNIARPGGIDKTEGREEMSARRTPKWASRPPGKVSIPVVGNAARDLSDNWALTTMRCKHQLTYKMAELPARHRHKQRTI